VPEFPSARLWLANPNEPQLITDITTDERVNENERTVMAQAGTRALAIIPLTQASRWVGLLALTWDEPHEFSAQEEEIYGALIGLAAPAVENRRWSGHLEELVEERTRKLEITTQELETFVYSISHDLRAPLRAMNSFSAILQEEYSDTLDEMGVDYLNRVRASSLRMSQLIDGLLALSRLGRNELRLVNTNLAHIAKRIFKEITKDESERKFNFQIMDLPLVEVDVNLIDVLLANLLNNAVKFTRGRDPAMIEFGYLSEEETPAFYIRDNGVGLDMKYADKLFTPFQRLHTEEEFEGTGVGLAIVQQVVRRHGGRIWSEAELDKGTTFYFTLQPFPREK
jgi:light-regulated signal transduction histidine kinase (bacteriophytochrome)